MCLFFLLYLFAVLIENEITYNGYLYLLAVNILNTYN